MLKPKGAKKLKQRAFTISEYHEQLMEVLLEKRGYTSYSEIVRDGIEEVYEHYFPPYRQETVAGKIKEKKLNEQQEQDRIKNLSPEDYANEYGVLVVKDKQGSNVALFYEFTNNDLRPETPEEMKRRLLSDPQWLDIHLAKCRNKSVKDRALELRDHLEAMGIIIE